MNVGAYTAHIRTSVRENTRYFFSDALLGAIGYVGFIGLGMLLYSATGQTVFFGRYSWNMLAWYLIVTQVLIHSQADVIKTINSQVQSGEIVTQMTKPFHYPLALLAMHLGNVLVDSVAVLVIAVPLGVIVAGTSMLSVMSVLAGCIAIILAILMDFFISMSIGLIAFWTEDARPYYWIYTKMIFVLGGLIFPLDLFSGTLQTVAKTLPPAFLMYYPARLFVDFSWDLFAHVLLGQLAYLTAAASIAFIVYRFAVRKVETNGG